MTKAQAEDRLLFVAEMGNDVMKAFDPASELLEIIIVNGHATIRTDFNSANQIHIEGHKIGGHDGRKEQA